ncbi:HIT family protein [Candidatus Woesearchaeota archaeon]|nr:HIT family protein [Candidatus Woesearchaeota archaeon]MCF7900636.1 HIT family protein [Candidatus Woesearchaeota archaeon]MCF8013476.1 HIT family protein [Candidatus Woesearchaeota archaeon]
MDNCIFCKIIKGDIPSKKIYEDEYVFAFLDITPATKGHTLIIPKKHTPNIYEIREADLKALICATKKIAELLKEKLGANACNLIQSNGKIANQDVFHFHMHLVPRYESDLIDLWEGMKLSKQKNKTLNLEDIFNKIIN